MQENADHHAHNAVKIVLQVTDAASAQRVAKQIAKWRHNGEQEQVEHRFIPALVTGQQYAP